MDAEKKYKIKELLRKASYIEKKNTGKRPTKKMMSDALPHIVKSIKQETPKENFKPLNNDPINIKDILGGMNGRT